MRLYEATRLRREREIAIRGRGLHMVEEIRGHPETKEMGRDKLIGAYEYVESLFPSAAPAVSAMRVLKNENTAFCRRLGVPPGAGGLFLVDASSILVCYNQFPDDVVVVHEMLHFVSQVLGSRFRNERAEEDFAYSKSIPYLVGIGWARERIRDEYLMPYYLGLELSKIARRPPASSMDEAREAARLTCCAIVSSELGDGPKAPPARRPSRFDDL
jgi:hypothetical protein